MQIFIAGGTGVLGRRIVARLLAAGHELTILARDPSRVDVGVAGRARVVEGDALDGARLHALLARERPELIMHQLTDLAAGSTSANARLRVEATRNLVDAARAAGTTRIVVQSIAWCYAPGEGPAAEDTPFDLVSAAPARRGTVDAVIAMEETAAALEHCVVLRNGLLYGPDTWYAPDGAVAAAARAGTLASGPDVSSFVQIDDAAAAAVAALDWPSGAVNIVDDEPAAASTWVPEFCAAVAAPAPAPSDDRVREGWARGARGELAHRLGWLPRFSSWREGFRSGLTPGSGNPVSP